MKAIRLPDPKPIAYGMGPRNALGIAHVTCHTYEAAKAKANGGSLEIGTLFFRVPKGTRCASCGEVIDTPYCRYQDHRNLFAQ